MEKNDSREEKIAAYLAGIMSPEEKFAFEQSLREDPTLQLEIEEYRKTMKAVRGWMEEDPPGMERTEQLTLPKIHPETPPRKSSVIPIRLIAGYAAVAILIFFTGFILGNKTRFQDMDLHTPKSPVQVQSIQQNVTPSPTPHPERKTEPDLDRRITRENGRIIIETSARGAATHSIWVVDGEFEIIK